MSTATGNAADIIELKIRMTNFENRVRDITDLCAGFTIYEDLFAPTSSVELLIIDAEGLPETAPIVGDEHVTIIYKTRGLKKNKEEYQTRVRSFQIYKLSKKEEAQERQHTYILHGVDDHQILNECIDLNQSYVGQNCTTAISKIFESSFIKTNEEFRPFDKVKKLYGLNQDDVIECNNSSFYIAPGVTPFESIMYLKEEAEHRESTFSKYNTIGRSLGITGNNNDYIFYQDYQGFHLTTITELKNEKPKFNFTVKDMAAELDNKKSAIPEDDNQYNDDEEYTTVIAFKIKKTMDTIQHLSLGTYGNRIAAIDILTKRFDEKFFNYSEEYKKLNTLDVGRLHTKNSIYKFSGSTHTRFIPTELLSSSIPTGVPTGFNNEISNYSQTPYFYPIDKENPDETKDKVVGTISNKAANERLQKLIQNDGKIANPRRKHYSLNKKISGKGILDTIIIDIIIPGNSDVKIGDIINFYIPQTSSGLDDGLYNMFFGQGDPKFLVVNCAQSFNNTSSGYRTTLTIVKDSYKDELETIVEKVRNTKGTDQ